jgi:beta-N-acetylhexosaminidase
MSTSLDSQLGQLFVLQLQNSKWNARVEGLLRSIQPAGVVVPLKSVRPLSFMRDLARGVASVLVTTPVMGMTDCQVGAAELVPSGPICKAGPPRQLRRIVRKLKTFGRMQSLMLRGWGCNTDFSLSLDLPPPVSGEAGERLSSGHDPQLLARCAAAYVRSLRVKQLMACGKHFPGMGSVVIDPHSATLLSAKPMAALWREDLVPFRKLLPKLPLVMISRAAYKAYDFDLPRPAIFSSEIVTGLLRVKLGYRGVAVANLSGVGVATKDSDIGDAAIKSLEAGCDLLVLPGNISVARAAMQAIKVARESGRISYERLEESLRRIRLMKCKLAKPSPVVSKKTLQWAAREIRECAAKLRMND